MSYIGALGINKFEEEIEDVSNTLVSRIVSDINYTSNYVLSTSNILVGRIRDTSNYADRLDLRIKALEGTEGSPANISLGIPAIPSTGMIGVAASIAALSAACVGLNGVSVFP